MRLRRVAAMLLAAIVVSCANTALAQDPSAAEREQPLAHAFGILSLVPPVMAIAVAVGFRRVLPGLLLGVVAGSLIAHLSNIESGNVWRGVELALVDVLEVHIWGAISDESHLRVVAFTLLMGAMVGILSRAAAMHGLVDAVAPWARGRRGGQMTGWLLGLIIFFDDYANCVLLGNTLRPIADRLRISREKLAYIVDSTAAPVAGLAIVSTWVAIEVSYIQTGLEAVGIQGDAYALLIESIPYRFYTVLTLFFVALVAWTDRDFGPMLAAERTAQSDERSARPVAWAHDDPELAPDQGTARRWYNAAVPVLVVLGVVLWLLYATGVAGIEREARESGARATITLAGILSHCDSYVAMLYGSLSGVVTAIVMVRAQRLLSMRQLEGAMIHGAATTVPSLAILVLAWALAGVTRDHLNAGDYLGGLLSNRLPPQWMPTLVFVLASAISFATGTSWGTMALIVPLSVSVTHAMLSSLGEVAPNDPLLVATIGSVLAGAIFGDHCSPISDTTVLSSQSSGCAHLAHVETQLPYAMLVAGVSIVFGTVPAGWGLPAWLLLPIGGLTLVLFLRFFGKRSGTP